MRKFSYWLCFILVAIPSVFTHVAWLLALAGLNISALSLLFFFQSLGSLAPPMIAPLLPRFVLIILGVVMLFLVLRRLWLLVRKHEGVPPSFTGTTKVLGYIGAISFSLSLVALLLTIPLRFGSGVPAGLLLLPAVFCVPWAFFLTEILSLRRASAI